MLKGQDVVVLLKLLGSDEPRRVRDLAAELGFDVAGTHRAIRRLGEAGLYSAERKRILPGPTEEFLLHAVKFSFPSQWGSEVGGIPTSWAAEPLSKKLAVSGGLPPVWPYYNGIARGLGLEPLHPIVPEAALRDSAFAERLALVDALRSKDSPRVTQLAEKLLKERIES